MENNEVTEELNIELDGDLTPKNNAHYSTLEYWELRYQRDTGLFDWFKKWEEVKVILNECMKPTDKILHIGCGNSTVGESLYVDGFHNIVNVDFSPSIILRMKEKYAQYEKMEWLEMDITDLKYPDQYFDIVLDKGTLDALLAPQKSVWELDEEKEGKQVNKMLSETYRVLKEGGKYIYITFGQPHFRKPLFIKPEYNWTLQLHSIVFDLIQFLN